MPLLIGYINNIPYKSNTLERTVSVVNIDFSNPFEKFSIYPNPSSGNINFNLDKSIKKYNIYIYNLSGKKVFSSKGINIGDNNLILSNLNNGTYIIGITSKTKKYSDIITIKK